MIEARTLLFLLKSVIRYVLPGSFVFFISLLIFDKLGLSVNSFIEGCWIMAIPSSVAYGVWLTSANFSWLIGLPISRLRLIFSQYILQFSIFTFALFTLTWITLAWNLYHQGSQQTLANITLGIDKLRTFFKYSPPSSWHLTTWANIIIFCTWFSLIPLLSLRKGRAGLQYYSSSYSLKTRRKAAMYGLGTVFIFTWARQWLGWGIIGYCVINSLAAYIGTQIAVHQLGLSPRSKKLRAGIGLCLAGINILVIVKIGQSHLRSDNANKIANVISFAGPYSGNADAVKIAHALESDLSAWNVEELGKFYKNLLNEKSALPPNGHPLTFRAAIQSKTSFDALTKAASLFDLKQISFDDLKLFLSTAEKIGKTNNADYLVYNFMSYAFSEAQLRELLESDSEILQTLAIRWVRFHPSNQFLALIQGRFDKLNENGQLKALTTLSLGAANEFHLRDYQSVKSAKLHFQYTPGDCNYHSAQDLKPSATNPLPKINFCLRALSLSKSGGTHQRIDSVGWYSETELKDREDSLKRSLGLKD